MITYIALPTDRVHALQCGGSDAHGQIPERSISDGQGKPCRHCLPEIPKGEEMLILAYRPFDDLHPCAETGPIFLCAKRCDRGGRHQIPEVLKSSPNYLIRGYSDRDRIVYGIGAIVAKSDMAARIKDILDNPEVAFVHARSASNNCYLARVDRVTKGA